VNSRLELYNRDQIKSSLFADLYQNTQWSGSLAQRCLTALCERTVLDVPLTSGLAARESAASDPALVRHRYDPRDNVPCPVVSSYKELYFNGTAGQAITFWRQTMADLERVNYFGVAVRAQPNSISEYNSLFVVSLIKISNDLNACPPYTDLPYFYTSTNITLYQD
jgi:hypothetical protein